MTLPSWLGDTNPDQESTVDDTQTSEKSERQTLHELRATVGNQALMMEVEKQTFEIAFEYAMECMAGGETITSFCHRYHSAISPQRFRMWITKDATRRRAYANAKALWAEALEDELIRISDGLTPDGGQSMDDTGRSTLRVNTRKWVMEKSNRKRYGDVKHIEQNTTTRIDVSAMTTEDLKRFIIDKANNDDAGQLLIDGEIEDGEF